MGATSRERGRERRQINGEHGKCPTWLSVQAGSSELAAPLRDPGQGSPQPPGSRRAPLTPVSGRAVLRGWEHSPRPPKPLLLLPPVPREGQDRGSSGTQDATAQRGKAQRRLGNAQRELRACAAHAEHGGTRRAGERDGHGGRFAATNCSKVGFHMFKHSERWKNYTHSPISPW